MAISSAKKTKWLTFTTEDCERLVRMGWEDRTTFDSIQFQFGLSPNEFVQFMRTQLDRKAFARWRKRVHLKGALKNEKTRGVKIDRFKCTRQRTDGSTKGWK